MNNDSEDMIGFLVVASDNLVIGITIDEGSFLLFRFLSGKPQSSSPLPILKSNTSGLDLPLTGYRQVLSLPSRTPHELFIVCLSSLDSSLNIFQFNFSNPLSPQLSFLKNLKLQADCLCVSYNEPQFYFSS
jgi:hypothetical protein